MKKIEHDLSKSRATMATAMLIGSFLLSGCATPFLKAGSDVNQDSQAKVVVTNAQKEQKEEASSKLAGKPEHKEFRPETLYALMLAEIALDRDMPDLSLSYYRREAYKTRDPAVIKRALEISTWLEVHQVSMELISLWQEVEPENAMAHKIMAQHQLYFGQVENSLDSIEKVLFLGEEFNFDFFNQVLPELDGDNRILVLRELEALSEKYPKNSQLWLARSHLYGLLDQRKSALDAASKAKRLDRNDDGPIIMYSELQFNYNDHDKALREMEKGLKKFPHSQALHFLYAQSLLKLGKIKRGEQEIKKSIELFPREYEFHFRLAALSANYKLGPLAKQLFTQSIKDNYRKEESLFSLNRIAQQEGNIEEAISFLKLIKPGAGFVEARLEIAYLLNEQGELQSAIDSLEEARFLQADDDGAFYQAQAQLLQESGQEQEALKIYSEAVEKFPENIKVRYGRAMLAESMDKLDITELDLLKVIELDSENAMALNALGYTLTNKTDRHKEALGYITKAYELSPNDPAIIDSMGWVQYQLGNYEEAISYLRKAIAMEADHEIAAHLGEVLWVSGEQQEAKKVWDEALARNKDSEVLKSVMEKFLK